jgi:hypothetical protein
LLTFPPVANPLLDSFGARYALIKIFSRFGKIAKLDFLFHKTGVMKGKPRGYAFVEFGAKEVSPSLNRIVTCRHRKGRADAVVGPFAGCFESSRQPSRQASSRP